VAFTVTQVIHIDVIQ